MAGTTLDLDRSFKQDTIAQDISNKYMEWEGLSRQWREEKRELRAFLFATDTRKTSVNTGTSWKNSTTIPKLTQIRDNLHANYMAALFSSDDWLKWEGESDEDEEKADKIVAYMKNKARQSGFETVVSNLVLDYIDFGNVVGTTESVSETFTDEEDSLRPSYIGPRAVRISPLDIVFNPIAASFDKTPKIVRSITTLGELTANIEDNPSDGWKKEILDDILDVRRAVNGVAASDSIKGHQFQIDGFSDIRHYYGSNYVELLEFHGDLYDIDSGEILRNHIITIADRRKVVRKIPNPSWTGTSRIKHAGWRLRPDNLHAMGPLDNLVGMQYRIDHLENLKADAFDMIAFPMIKIKGQVDHFDYIPGEKIIITDEDGDVGFLHPDTAALAADNQIALLEARMEEMAGAPKQALGIRTPGEKTKFEVQQLENAAGRVFQNKIAYFEENVMLPLLNDMLELARRNMDEVDVIRVLDDEFGHVVFKSISEDDLSAKGTLRPVGSRHFAAQANLVQNINAFFSSPLGADPAVNNHISGKRLAKLVFEEALDMRKYNIVEDNIRVTEQFETQELVNSGGEALGTELPSDQETGGTTPLGVSP